MTPLTTRGACNVSTYVRLFHNHGHLLLHDEDLKLKLIVVNITYIIIIIIVIIKSSFEDNYDQ